MSGEGHRSFEDIESVVVHWGEAGGVRYCQFEPVARTIQKHRDRWASEFICRFERNGCERMTDPAFEMILERRGREVVLRWNHTGDSDTRSYREARVETYVGSGGLVLIAADGGDAIIAEAQLAPTGDGRS